MWRCFTLASLLALAACQPEGDAVCAAEESTYSVTAQVSLAAEVAANAGKTVGAGEPGVLATVWQSSSVTSCSGGLVSSVSPGNALVKTRPVSVDAAGFTLRFSENVYPELDAPALDLEVLLDENGNGRCDDGEPSGNIALPRSQRARVRIELQQRPCRLRL